MNDYDFLSQPIWLNEHLKLKGKCLFFDVWIQSDIFFVYELFDNSGKWLNETALKNMLISNRNWISEYMIIKTVIGRLIQKHHFKTENANYINKTDKILLNTGKHIIQITNQKSNFFYGILRENKFKRNYMEKVWNRTFDFHINTNRWSTIYIQNIVDIKDSKLSEFKYNILNNLIPCNSILYKWKRADTDKCSYCDQVETVTHMLYKCSRVNDLWKKIGSSLKLDIQWKHLVLGLQFDNECGYSNNLILVITLCTLYKFWYINKNNPNTSFSRFIRLQLQSYVALFYTNANISKHPKQVLKTLKQVLTVI